MNSEKNIEVNISLSSKNKFEDFIDNFTLFEYLLDIMLKSVVLLILIFLFKYFNIVNI